MDAPIAEARFLSKSFPDPSGREVVVVEDFSLAVREGEWVALLGQSGSGKSTILRCLIGLAKPTAGHVLCHGHSFDGIHPDASMVFQTFALFPWLTVEQNISVGLASKALAQTEKRTAVKAVIELIGLSHYHDSYPRELSGGMRQRVAIARALVSQPGLLCLDEAFSGLDVLTGENLRQEMLSLWRRKDSGLRSIFMVTHNIEEAVETATRIAVLFPNPGRLGLVLENPLPYPRDSQSPEFRRLVSLIHDAITQQYLPDKPTAPLVLPGILSQTLQPEEAPHPIEAIPPVPIGQLLGLLSILEDASSQPMVYELSNEIGREFGEVIALVKAAEILGLVETPGNAVGLTDLGRRFHSAHREERKQLFKQQIVRLGLFRHVIGLLKERETLTESEILSDLRKALPYENETKTFQTLLAWGRYAGLLRFDVEARSVRLHSDP